MHPGKSKKKKNARMGRRELLKSVAVVTGGYATVLPFLGPGGWPMTVEAASATADPLRYESVSEGSDSLAKIKTGQRIDVHQHAILPEYLKALERSGIVENSQLKTKVFTPESILEVAGELGMDCVVLLPFSSSGIHHGNDENARYLTQATNDAMAKLSSNSPKKIGFYAIVPLPDIDGALKQMEYALDSLHADGIALLSTQNGVYMGDSAFREVYAEMSRRSAVVFIHPARPTYALPLKLGPSLIEYTFETTRVAVNLIYNDIVPRYPNIKWILAHAGGTLPYVAERLKVLQGEDSQKPSFLERVPAGYAPYLKQFYYDVATAGGRVTISALTELADPSHIFYGSDWPYVMKEEIAQQVINCRESPQFAGRRLEAMERKNATVLFKRFV